MSRRAIAFGLAVLVVFALGLLEADRAARSTRTPAPVPTSQATLPIPSATATPKPTPRAATVATDAATASATPTAPPTPTPRPLRLAVDQPTYTRFRDALRALPDRRPDWAVVPYPEPYDADRLLAGGLAEAALVWSTTSPPESALLRVEPFVAAFHVTHAERSVSLGRLAALARGEEPGLTLVTAPDGRAALRELLGVEPSVALELPGWEAAKEHVATHPDAWALLPWEAVDFRVLAAAVDGVRPDPRHLGGYPLVRRLWLHAADDTPADALGEELATALHYEPPPVVELVAVGDVMLGRTVGRLIAADSSRYPFEGEGVLPILRGADVTFGNLECPLSDRGSPVAKRYTFRADPAAIDGLAWAGFDVLSLANNHLGDYGADAVRDTLGHLADAGLTAVGAGETAAEAYAPRVVDVDGLRLAFLAYNQVTPESFAATETRPGLAWMDLERMAAAVRAARAEADLAIVSCHWGIEYSAYPTAVQERIAQTLSDAGADLIVGHHSHVVQGLHYHADTFTAYSLGNYVFDIDMTPESLEGVMMRCLLDATGVKTVAFVPVAIDNCRPVVMDPARAEGVLQRMERVTRERQALPSPR